MVVTTLPEPTLNPPQKPSSKEPETALFADYPMSTTTLLGVVDSPMGTLAVVTKKHHHTNQNHPKLTLPLPKPPYLSLPYNS